MLPWFRYLWQMTKYAIRARRKCPILKDLHVFLALAAEMMLFTDVLSAEPLRQGINAMVAISRDLTKLNRFRGYNV